MTNETVISLFDYTGNMVRPWAESGYKCLCFDIQHPALKNHTIFSYPSGGEIRFIKVDLLTWRPYKDEYDAKILFAFPPCTDVAVSGARHFKNKGLGKLINALKLFKASIDIAEKLKCPYMLENPVSTVSTYWRKPDHIFQPYDFTGFCPHDNYTKKTCLWTGNGFVIPKPRPDLSLGTPDNRIHKAPPDLIAQIFEAPHLSVLQEQFLRQIRT